MSNDVLATDEQFATGSRVALDRHVYGHVAGSKGVIVSGQAKGSGKVLVRFDTTGYQISVPREALRVVAGWGPERKRSILGPSESSADASGPS